jgi:type II secretory pathway pseudopilin PulG
MLAKMNTHQKSSTKSQCGMTRLEVLIVIAVVLMVAGLLAPAIPNRRVARRVQRTKCMNNLRQIGVAFSIYAKEHDQQFPFQLDPPKGLRDRTNQQAYRHFLAMSNELYTPKILACPSDVEKRRESAWNSFSDESLSYFIGYDADPKVPESLLAGDRNAVSEREESCAAFAGALASPLGTNATWSKAIHKFAGNVGLANGSVQQMTTASLRAQVARANVYWGRNHVKVPAAAK